MVASSKTIGGKLLNGKAFFQKIAHKQDQVSDHQTHQSIF